MKVDHRQCILITAVYAAVLCNATAAAQSPPIPSGPAMPASSATVTSADSGAGAVTKPVEASVTEVDEPVDDPAKAPESADSAQLAETVREAVATAKAATDALKQQQYSDLKASKLIQYGITAGTAFAVQTGWSSHGTRGVRQESAGVSAMPYVLFVPAYWFKPAITRTYCATAFGSDRATAREAAVAASRKEAAAQLSVRERALYDKAIGNVLGVGEASDDKTPDSTTIESVAKTEADALRKVEHNANVEWARGGDGSCWSTRIGGFVGKPLAWDASVKPGKNEDQRKREINSFFAAGFAYVPNAYVTLLAGVSWNYLNVDGKAATDTEPATPDQMRRYLTFMLGFGGNIDIVGTLFSKM